MSNGIAHERGLEACLSIFLSFEKAKEKSKQGTDLVRSSPLSRTRQKIPTAWDFFVLVRDVAMFL